MVILYLLIILASICELAYGLGFQNFGPIVSFIICSLIGAFSLIVIGVFFRRQQHLSGKLAAAEFFILCLVFGTFILVLHFPSSVIPQAYPRQAAAVLSAAALVLTFVAWRQEIDYFDQQAVR